MLNRPSKVAWPQGLLFVVLALAFAATAALQAFLASQMSVWWPAVLAAVFALAALACLYAAIRYWHDDDHRHMP